VAQVDIIIQIDEPFLAQVNPARLEQALLITCHFCSTSSPESTVSIVITDNHTVQQLNHRYRGIDAPTDVLSFDSVPDSDFPHSETTSHLGDIIIAYPVAEVQALAAGHTALEELILLTVHGGLHLLGFDHDTPTNKNKMWAAQHQIMAELGLAHIQPTENQGV
jgi:probable rRNA maturation factor